MSGRPFAAILFDMDGVLIDSVAIYERHWRAWAVRHGLDPEAPIAVHHGHSAIETITLVAPHLDARAEAAAYNRGLAADERVDGVIPLPGALAAIAAIGDGRWAVVTSASNPIAERCLAAAGIRPATLVGIEDVDRGKPAPDPYLAAAERLGVDARDCLVIEDAPPGLAAARAAGATALGLATTHEPGRLRDAIDVVESLAALTIRHDGDRLVVAW